MKIDDKVIKIVFTNILYYLYSILSNIVRLLDEVISIFVKSVKLNKI
jgi:hypothetical protein